jgi:outer membrane protein assembly factor BamB
MKKQIIIFGTAFIGISLWLSSCSKEQLDSAPQIIWEKRLTYKNYFSSMPPCINGNKVAISMDSSFMQNTPSSPIFFFDKNTGEFIKKWDDFFEPQKEMIRGGGSEPFRNQEKLSFCSNRKTFTVDLNTGQTLFKKWDKDYNGGLAQVTGLGNVLYRHLSNELQNSDSEDYVMEYNTLTGKDRIVYQTKGKDGYNTNLRYLNLSVDNQGDTILVITHILYNVRLNLSKTSLIKYNITKQQLVFEKDLSDRTGNFGTPCPSMIAKNRIYTFVGPWLFCHDFETGAELWFKELGGIVFSSDPVIANNTLYVNDESKTLSAIQLETGQLLWKTTTAGTSGNLKFMNDVIYFEGGSDGLLYAVDATNGQIFYKFRCPDQDRASGLFWQNVSVDPSTNRLYATSYGALYCLSAVR